MVKICTFLALDTASKVPMRPFNFLFAINSLIDLEIYSQSLTNILIN